MDPQFSYFAPIAINVKGTGPFSIQRPDHSKVEATSKVAKEIFVKAFETSYTRYHKESGSEANLEEWLKIKVPINQWLSEMFDEEYEEYKKGQIGFIYLADAKDRLAGWLSHSQVDEKGCIYLSLCSLETSLSNRKIASTAFKEVLENDHLVKMIPNVKEIKLVTRKINTVAQRLYTGAGFICDETINPSDYGASYDNRYIGFRRKVS